MASAMQYKEYQEWVRERNPKRYESNLVPCMNPSGRGAGGETQPAAFRIVHLGEVDSTNDWLRRQVKRGETADMAVWADAQTAGRGCGSNAWESEPGQNLLVSVLLHPTAIPAPRQFVISMANALALAETLDRYVGGITVKWPNDIYLGDGKLAGTLIEPTLSAGRIASCIIGTGVNVGQRVFRSDAPNPVSLAQVLDRTVQVETLLHDYLAALQDRMAMLADEAQWPRVRRDYERRLYRREGVHPYEADTLGRFMASFVSVDDDGTLHLDVRDADGASRPHAFRFKEVRFVLP